MIKKRQIAFFDCRSRYVGVVSAGAWTGRNQFLGSRFFLAFAGFATHSNIERLERRNQRDEYEAAMYKIGSH